jgi:hypothetical protein
MEGADATGALLRVSVRSVGYSNVPGYQQRPTPYTIGRKAALVACLFSCQ